MPRAQGFYGSAPTAGPAAQWAGSQGGSSVSMSLPIEPASFASCWSAPMSACSKPRVARSSRHRGGGGSDAPSDEMGAFADRLKSDIMAEIRTELSGLSASILESNRQLTEKMEQLSADMRALQGQRSFLASQGAQSPTARLMANCVQSLCGGGGRCGALVGGSARGDVAKEPEPSQMPLSPVRTPRRSPAVAARLGESPPASLRRQGSSSGSMVAPVVAMLQQTVSPPGGLVAGEATELAREPFIQSLDVMSQMLDKLGGNMGSYLQTNITKLKKSKADNTKIGYKEWLLSELPVHAATGYKAYVDDSAWMGNLWMGWTLEFFVELFALLHKGKDTKTSVDDAYKKSLYNHHNFFQRTTFTAAVTQIPPRDKLLKSLRGSGSDQEVLKEIGEFVDLGRPIVQFCLKTNDALSQRMERQRNAKK